MGAVAARVESVVERGRASILALAAQARKDDLVVPQGASLASVVLALGLEDDGRGASMRASTVFTA